MIPLQKFLNVFRYSTKPIRFYQLQIVTMNVK